MSTEIEELQPTDYQLIHSSNKLLTPLSLVERQMVDMYASGYSIKSIAMELGCPISIVKSTLNKPQIREVANSLVMDTGIALKAERYRILNAVIEDKLKLLEEQVDEDGNQVGRMGYSTNKDIIDLLKIADDIGKEKEKKELGTNQSSVYIQLINNLME